MIDQHCGYPMPDGMTCSRDAEHKTDNGPRCDFHRCLDDPSMVATIDGQYVNDELANLMFGMYGEIQS